MDSILANTYLALQEKIKADIPEIKWVDLDYGQLDFFDVRPSVLWPCCLIAFPQTDYREKQLRNQHATPIINFKLGFESFNSTSGVTPLPIVEKGLFNLELEHKLYLTLQDFNPGELLNVPLNRLASIDGVKGQSWIAREISFKAMFDDRY